MRMAHLCPETGEHYIVTAVYDKEELDYVPACGHCRENNE